MAGFTQMSFTPDSGLNDRDAYPATPVSEGEARSAVQGISDQIKDYINKVLLHELQNADTDKSGAERIGSAAIQYLDNNGIHPLTVRKQIELLAAKLNDAAGEGISISDIIEEGDITGLMISANAITTDKITDGAVTANKIADGVIDGGSLSDGSVTAQQLGYGVVETDKIQDEAVTETKLGAGAVSKLKLHTETRAIIPSLNEGIGTFSTGQNLDMYLTVGTYICTSDATAAGLANCPAALAFKLFVDYARGQSDYIIQICRDRTGNQFFRSKAPNEPWTCWIRQATVIFGTSASPPAGTYPAGTLYVQYQE